MDKNKKYLPSRDEKLKLLQFTHMGRQAQAIYLINVLKIFIAVFFIVFNLVYLSDIDEKNMKIIRLTISISVILLCIILLRLRLIHAAAILTCTGSFAIFFFFPVFFKFNLMEIYISNTIIVIGSCIIPSLVFRIREDFIWIISLTVILLLLNLLSDNIIIYRFGKHDDVFTNFYKEKILFLTLLKTALVIFLSSISIFISRINQKHESVIHSMQEKLKGSHANLETQIHERTQTLEEKNKRLLEYTYINSHLLRGPVARLKGLMLLTEIDKSATNIDFCHTNINIYLSELDSIIEIINKILNEEDPSEIAAIQDKVRKMYSVAHLNHQENKH